MSANTEKGEPKTRVTRSMRRINSTESLNSENERPETPTGRMRNAKTLKVIEEASVTPTRRSTRAGSIQRNLITEESKTPSSPLRRVTRRMSVDNNVDLTAISSPARTKRVAANKQKIVESEDDDVMFVDETVATPRTKTNSKQKRCSVSVVKLEEVAEEEHPEIETSDGKVKDSIDQLNKSADSEGDLQQLDLRNRSISKSPSTNQRISTVSSDVLSVIEISSTIYDNTITSARSVAAEMPSPSKKKISTDISNNDSTTSAKKSKSRESINENTVSTLDKSSDNDTEVTNLMKSPQKASKAIENAAVATDKVQTPKATPSRKSKGVEYQAVDTANDHVEKVQTPKATPSRKSKGVEYPAVDTANDHVEKVQTPKTTPSRKLKMAEIQADDTANENAEKVRTPKATPSRKSKGVEKIQSPKVQASPKIVKNSNNAKEIDNVFPEANNAKDTSLLSRDSGISTKDLNLEEHNPDEQKDYNQEDEAALKKLKNILPSIQQQSQKEMILKLNKLPSFNNKTHLDADDMTLDSDNEEPSLHDETNKQVMDMDLTTVNAKSIDVPKSASKTKTENNTWSQSVRGTSKPIDELKQPDPEVIQDKSEPLKFNRESADEKDEEESEGCSQRLYIDEEAMEVDSDHESMTKSERDYLEQNEVTEHGESIGSQDTNEFSETEDEDNDDDSFIVKDDDVPEDDVSMDSCDKQLEEEEEEIEKEQKKKRHSRIIMMTDSSDEEKQLNNTDVRTEINSVKTTTGKKERSSSEVRMLAEFEACMAEVGPPKYSPSETQSPTASQVTSKPTESDKKATKSLPTSEVTAGESYLNWRKGGDDENGFTSSQTSSQSPIKTQKPVPKSRKSLPASQEMSLPAESGKKSRKSLPVSQNLDDIKAVTAESPAKKEKSGKKSLPASEVTAADANNDSGENLKDNLCAPSTVLKSPMSTLYKASLSTDSQTSSSQSPIKTQKPQKKSRKSLPTIPEAEPTISDQSRMSLPNHFDPQSYSDESEISQIISKYLPNARQNDTCDTSTKETSFDETKIGRKRKREQGDVVSKSKRQKKISTDDTEDTLVPDQSNSLDDNQMEVEDFVLTQAKKRVQVHKKSKRAKLDELEEFMAEQEVEQANQSNNKDEKEKELDIASVLERCNAYMLDANREKKARRALKKERLVKKLEKKQKEKEVAASDNLDSSNGENKENSIKKKKKKASKKKNKLLDEIDDGKKEDLSEKLDKLQQKMELKRQRKKEKKLAKLQQQSADNAEPAVKTLKIPVEASKQIDVPLKKAKKPPVEEPVVVKEKQIPDKASKQTGVLFKKTKKFVVEEPVVEKTKKKMKRNKPDEMEVDQEVVPEPKVKQPKKALKRSASEIVTESDTDAVEKPKAKKKLKILKQVENSSPEMINTQKKVRKNIIEIAKPGGNLTSKLNQIIPKGLGNAEKMPKKKKKVTLKPEPIVKRPVWTTSGTFIEESIAPYTFQTTEYKPINIGSTSSTKYGVVAFTASKKSGHNVVDFKMQQMIKRGKNRDKSIKNLKNLM